MKTKFKNGSGLLLFVALAVFLFSVFKAWGAFSMSNLFVLENVSVLAKSDTLNEGAVSVEGNKISADAVKFHKVGDYITYCVKIKNDKNENYILQSISDDNNNEYVSYSYDDYKDIRLNSGESFDFVFTETYSTEVEDIQKRQQNFSVNFYFKVKPQKEGGGSAETEGKVTLDKKPVTGDSIEFYVILSIISLVVSLFILKKTGMKNIKKGSLGVFVLFTALYIAFIPQMAKSLEGQTFKMELGNSAELKDKLIVAYDIDGITNKKIIPYNTKVSIDEPYKEGYTFKGWRTDDGALFDLDTLIKDDINLTAVFEADTYGIIYSLNGGQAENPDSYTIEDEVQINDPLRDGYTFAGWTGTDLSDLTKNLVIPRGSMGDRTYEAHWTANEYTVLFDVNTGSGSMNPVTLTYDEPSYLPANRFTKTDNKFICWNTRADGSGDSYTNEAYVKNLAHEGEVTLYAQWGSASDWAMFKDGQWLNAQMKQLAGNGGATYETVDNNIFSIERSQNPAPLGATTISVKSISSPSPLDMWYDSSNHTIYYYSPAKYIYLNADSKNTFGYFGALTSIDYNGFMTDEVTNMHSMFAHTTSLTELDLSTFNTAKVTDMGSVFNQCTGASVIDVSKFDTRRVRTMNRMFTACEKVKDLDLSRFNTSSVTDMEKMFDYLPLVESIELDHFNTQNVTKMTGMFRDCPNLKTLDLSSFDTRNVTNMSEMFGCSDRVESSGLTSITIDSAKFNTAKVNSMKQMFYKCSKLTSFDFSGFNTANVTDMASMFAQCHSLTSLNLSSFDTPKVTTMQSMFNNCNSLASINVSNFDTHLVRTTNRMFSSCRSLVTLDVSSFNTQSVTDMTKMFDNMSALTTIYVSDNFTTASVASGSDVFKNDTNLVGGSGTACDGQQRLGYTYARIDGGESAPGYFTRKV